MRIDIYDDRFYNLTIMKKHAFPIANILLVFPFVKEIDQVK